MGAGPPEDQGDEVGENDAGGDAQRPPHVTIGAGDINFR